MRLNPLNDYLIVKMFGETGDEEQLLSLANAVVQKTGKRFTSVAILADKTLTAEVLGNKKVILDVRAVTDALTRFDMEIQLRNQGNMIRRSLHYWSGDYRRGIAAGENYRALPDVIAVNILNFPYIGLGEFHTSFHIYEDAHKDYKLTDALELHFIEMPLFRKLAEKDMQDPLHRWLMFLDQETPPEVLEEVVTMDRGIQKAQERMDLVTMDREAYWRYELREAQIAFYDEDVQSAAEEKAAEAVQKATAKAQAAAEKAVQEATAKAQAAAEKAVQEAAAKAQAAEAAAENKMREIARKLKARGISLEDIIESTNLSAEEIAGL
jgi:predicted transposase/invertase (TIGR01784 family)